MKRKKVFEKKPLILFLCAMLTCGQFPGFGMMEVKADDNLEGDYNQSMESIISQTGDETIKTLGESFIDDEDNVTVVYSNGERLTEGEEEDTLADEDSCESDGSGNQSYTSGCSGSYSSGTSSQYSSRSGNQSDTSGCSGSSSYSSASSSKYTSLSSTENCFNDSSSDYVSGYANQNTSSGTTNNNTNTSGKDNWSDSSDKNNDTCSQDNSQDQYWCDNSDTNETIGTVYYIDPDGDDDNDGTSPQKPWASVEKINATTFEPGDMILFKAGGEWDLDEALHPLGSGTEDNKIVIGAYGNGAKPKLTGKNISIEWTFTDDSTRYASDVIYLENQEYIEIRDLDISNSPDGYTGEASDEQSALRADRRGIHVVGGNNTTETELDDIWIHDNYIHDVAGESNGVSGTGWDPSKRTAGILFEIAVIGDDGLPVISNPVDVGDYEPTYFNDILIEDNVLVDNSFGGIIVKQLSEWGARDNSNDYPYYDLDGWYPNTNVTIQNNYLNNAGSDYAADTIYLTCSQDSLIKNNVSCGAGTSAIELYFDDSITVEYNEVYDATQKVTGADSNAIDSDKASTNTLMQYNYVHDCGDGILLCGFIYGSSVVRYNVIQDSSSSKRYLNVHGSKGYNYIYNNIFYNSSDDVATFVNSSGGSTYMNSSSNHHYLENNIFYSPDAESLVIDGTSTEYLGNVYYNVDEVPEEDTDALVVDPQFEDISTLSGGEGEAVDLEGFRLLSTSPLINAGKTLDFSDYLAISTDTLVDFSGSDVEEGSADVGIYEFTADASEQNQGGINGYVYDQYGVGQADTTVTATVGRETYTTTSDDQGFYSIYGIKGQEAEVDVDKDDYEDVDPISVELTMGDIVPCDMTLGECTSTVGSLSGQVSIGEDIAITLTDSSDEVVAETTTDEDGEFTIEDIPVGTGYSLLLEKDNYEDLTEDDITIYAGYDTDLGDLVMSYIYTELNMLFEEDFDYDVGDFEGNDVWNVSDDGGEASIVEGDNGNKYLRVNKSSNSDSIKVWNSEAIGATDVFTIETRIKRTTYGSSASQCAIYSSETISDTGSASSPMADTGFYKGTTLFTHYVEGSSSTKTFTGYSSNEWYVIKMVVNMDTDTFDYYIDDDLMLEGAQLRTAGDAINYFSIFASTNNIGDICVDYIKVYQGEPDESVTDVDSVSIDEMEDASWTLDTSSDTFSTDSILSADTDEVTVRVKPTSDFATVTIDDTKLETLDDDEYVLVPVEAGENDISFTVESLDGTTQSYTLEFEREDENLVSYLTDLSIDGLTLSPEFDGTNPDEDTVEYDAGTTYESSHTLTYETAAEGETVTVSVDQGTVETTSSGSIILDLVTGETTITIDVASESNDNFKTYTITVDYVEETSLKMNSTMMVAYKTEDWISEYMS